MITFKKLLPFLIVIVVIAAAGAGLYWQKQWQKTHIPLDISPAAVEAKCLEDVGKMNEEQIIEKINTLPFATGEELGKMNQLMYKHLRCQFFENPFEEQFEKTKSLIGMIKVNEQDKVLWIENLSKYLKTAQENREDVERRIFHFTFPLIVYTKERLCPNGEEDQVIVEKWMKAAVEAGYSGATLDKVKNSINTYCDRIIKYTEDEASLIREVYELKNWPGDSMERRFEYRRKTILAFRFGGEIKALEVCNNLSGVAEKKDCQEIVDDLNGWPIRQIRAEGCTGYELKEAKDLICQPRGQ